jgi:hypothetical protein
MHHQSNDRVRRPYSDFNVQSSPGHPEKDTENQLRQRTKALPPTNGLGPPHLQSPKATKMNCTVLVAGEGDKI